MLEVLLLLQQQIHYCSVLLQHTYMNKDTQSTVEKLIASSCLLRLVWRGSPFVCTYLYSTLHTHNVIITTTPTLINLYRLS